MQADVVEPLGPARWRVSPRLGASPGEDGADARRALRGLRAGTALSRNRDAAWERLLAKPSAERRIAVDLTLATLRRDGGPAGLELTLKDEDGFRGVARVERALEPPRDPQRAEATLREQLCRLGATRYAARRVRLAVETPWFVPASVLNALRRDATAALDAARDAGLERLPRATPADPPAPCPEDTLSYLANVYNGKAAAFYARHGVKVVGAAYESHEALGEVSLMITKHCVRYSLSLCPKQARGVTGVQGTVRAEPLVLQHGEDRLTLRFDCKPCEMHVVGAMRRNVLGQLKAEPVTFYRTR
jgi:putative protease